MALIRPSLTATSAWDEPSTVTTVPPTTRTSVKAGSLFPTLHEYSRYYNSA
jgi:hypothetical protein